MKKILFLILSIMILSPSLVHAQVDQRCWIEKDCYDARKSLFKVETPRPGEPGWEKVFRNDDISSNLCDGKTLADGTTKVGLCLPAVTAKTGISIGGQQEFTGLAQFIAFIYEYGLSLAAIIAVLMIIFAGVQWTISGGNSEAISSAQRKIYGSIIGLVILATAYTILYTVNPNLVNLQPPNVWMINTQKIAASYCSEITNSRISKKPAMKTGESLTKEAKETALKTLQPSDWVAPTSTGAGECGSDYYVERSGALTCTGMACPTGSVCFNSDGSGNKCTPATIGGTISNSSAEAALLTAAGGLVRTVFGEGWTYPWVANGSTEELEIYIVCNNGDHSQLNIQYPIDPGKSTNLRPDQKQVYAVTASTAEITEQWNNYCTEKGDKKGFILAVEFNESGDGFGLEEHFLGRSLTATENGTRTYQAYDLLNESNDWKNCILRNAPAPHFFTKDELIQGITLNINASNIADIDNGDEDEVSQKIYYSGTKTSGIESAPAGTEVCGN